MARGIISTILGGVAGGLEGRRLASVREREEAERAQERKDRLERDRAEAQQQQLINMLAVRREGGSIGGAPRIAQEAAIQPAAPSRSPLDSALFEGTQATRPADMGESVIERPDFGRPVTPVGSALASGAMADRGREIVGAPDFSRFERPRTEFVVDPDYEEITIGDQTFSFLTNEAMERRAAEVAQRDADAAAALRQEQREHEMNVIALRDELQAGGDERRHNFSLALENLRHRNALERTTGTGDVGLGVTQKDIEDTVLNMVREGKEVYNAVSGAMENVPYTVQEIRSLILDIENALGRNVGLADRHGGVIPGEGLRPGPTNDALRMNRQMNNLGTMINAPRMPFQGVNFRGGPLGQDLFVKQRIGEALSSGIR